jgi:hypothetical protein
MNPRSFSVSFPLASLLRVPALAPALQEAMNRPPKPCGKQGPDPPQKSESDEQQNGCAQHAGTAHQFRNEESDRANREEGKDQTRNE